MNGASATAELIADRGEAASTEDFFRSRPFLDAEGATHTLRISAADLDLLAPVIVRTIGGGPEVDAGSPYGYPGLVAALPAATDESGAAGSAPAEVDPAAVDFAPTGLISLFLRHRLGKSPLAGAAGRNVVQIVDPALPLKRRPSDRNQINKNRRKGYELELVRGPQTTAEQRAGFFAAYEQTMRRTDAAERYFFAAAYFDRILESEQAWLALALAPGGETAAASIAVRSVGFIHYYLSGTADPYMRDSPMKSIVSALVELATAEGLPLNLGGGISSGDRLEEFKRGFANREERWQSSEIVCDAVAYERLSAGTEPTGFFPAYRAI